MSKLNKLNLLSKYDLLSMSWSVIIDLIGVNLSKTNSKSVSALDGILCEEGIGDCVISKHPSREGKLRTYHTIFSEFPNHKFTA